MDFQIAASAGALIVVLLVVGLIGFWRLARREGHDARRTVRALPEDLPENVPGGDGSDCADESDDDDDSPAPGPGMHDFVA